MSIYSVRDELKEAHLTIALTGAGVSVESGIPDFRSPGELNLEPTGLTHTGKVRHFIEGKATETLSRLADLLAAT